MAEKKISRKELLKSPDEFLTFTQKAVNFVQANSKKITIAITAVIIIVIVIVGVNWYRNSQEQKALVLYNEALDILPPNADSDSSKYQSAISILEPLTVKYANTSSGRTALIDLGRSYYALGQFDQALKAYRTFLNAMPTSESQLKPLVLSSMAYALEAKGDLSEATKRWQEVIDQPGDMLEQEAYLGLGRIYQALEQKKEAITAYQSLLKAYPDTPQKDLAEHQIKTLQE